MKRKEGKIDEKPFDEEDDSDVEHFSSNSKLYVNEENLKVIPDKIRNLNDKFN